MKNEPESWEGKTYLEPLEDAEGKPIEIRRVIRPSSNEEIERHRETLERFTPTENEGTFSARVKLEGGSVAEFKREGFEALWRDLAAFLSNPETKWLEFSGEVPDPEPESGRVEFTIENKNVSTTILQTDGTSVIRKASIPLQKGDALPIMEEPSLREYLEGQKYALSTPLPKALFDSHYSEEELRARGVTDAQSLSEHVEKTKGEELWRGYAADREGNILWEKTSSQKEEIENGLLRFHEENEENHYSGGIERIERKVGPRQHPLEFKRRYALTAVLNALQRLEKAGDDSPEAEALLQGIRLAATLQDLSNAARAPEAIKRNRIHSKRPRKGRQIHKKKRDKTRHLDELTRRVIEEKGDPKIPPRKVLEALRAAFYRETRKPLFEFSDERIQHPEDEGGYSLNGFRWKVIKRLKAEVFET